MTGTMAKHPFPQWELFLGEVLVDTLRPTSPCFFRFLKPYFLFIRSASVAGPDFAKSQPIVFGFATAAVIYGSR